IGDRNGRFFTTKSAVFEDPRVSAVGKAVYALVFCKPPDWEHSLPQIESCMREGDKAVRAGIKSLEDAGYCSKVQGHKDGGQGFASYIYTFREIPLHTDSVHVPEGEAAPHQEQAQSVHSRNRHIGQAQHTDSMQASEGEAAPHQEQAQSVDSRHRQAPKAGSTIKHSDPTKEPTDTGEARACALCKPAHETAAPPTEHLMRLHHRLYRDALGMCPTSGDRKKLRGICARLLTAEPDLEKHAVLLGAFFKSKDDYHERRAYDLSCYEDDLDRLRLALSKSERQEKERANNPYATPGINQSKLNVVNERLQLGLEPAERAALETKRDDLKRRLEMGDEG
ncbi:MAG TPA: hypothetical protein VFI02_22020, partial [Armatimonadota bacterium]|nr:hypothetical protein [Armatimonadota bacterium]